MQDIDKVRSRLRNNGGYLGHTATSRSGVFDLRAVEEGFNSAPLGTLLRTFSAPSSSPWGLTIKDGDLVSADSSNGNIYLHDGISDTIQSSFYFSASVSGLHWDGTDLWSVVRGLDRLYRHSGFSSTIAQQVTTSANDICGLALDDTYAYFGDRGDFKIRRRLKSTLGSEIAFTWSPTGYWPHGLVYIEESGLWIADSNVDEVFNIAGFTPAVNKQFDINAVGNFACGDMTYDPAENTLIVSDYNSDLFYVYSLGPTQGGA